MGKLRYQTKIEISYSSLPPPPPPRRRRFIYRIKRAVTLFALVGRRKSRKQHQSSHHLNVNFPDQNPLESNESASKTEPQHAMVFVSDCEIN
jgi:hypothetical protein